MPCDPRLLSGVELFEHLDDEGREQLAEAIESRTLRAGETLFAAGEPGDALFIVKSGQVELFIKDKAGCASPSPSSTSRSVPSPPMPSASRR
jgi:CRP-like cAMP-binding protein